MFLISNFTEIVAVRAALIMRADGRTEGETWWI